MARTFYIKVDDQGFVSGLHDTALGPYPEDGIEDFFEVSQAVFDEMATYQGLRRWDGEKIVEYTPPPPPPSIPQVVSRFQARAALHMAGLLPQVEAAIAAADPIVQMAWVDAQEFRRDSPTIAAMAHSLGMSDSDVDDLFTSAAQIVA